MSTFKLDPQTEHQLMQELGKGEEAFEKLYHHYFPLVYGFVYKRTGHRETTEDLVSIIFLKAFSNAGKFQDKGFSFGSWLFRIATNTIIDHYKKAQNRRETPLEFDIAHDVEDQSHNIDNNIKREKILEALNKLPDKYQKIIYLKYFAEMETDEISQAMEIKTNNVRVILHRAIKSFQKKWPEQAALLE